MISSIPESPEDAADRFYAKNYERLYSSYLSDTRMVDSICSFLKDRIDSSHAILIDIGCGIGSQLKDVSSRLSIPGKRCYGIDRSPSMGSRFDETMKDTGAVFILEDLHSATLHDDLKSHALNHKIISDVIVLCLGNVIGLVDQADYPKLASLLSFTIDNANVHYIFEYRNGDKYRSLCPVERLPNDHKSIPESFGSAEVIGQHDSDFFAFYIRRPVDETRYNVNIFALSTASSGETKQCSLCGMYIQNGFYVDADKLKSSMIEAGFVHTSDFGADSSLETGEIRMFNRLTNV